MSAALIRASYSDRSSAVRSPSFARSPSTSMRASTCGSMRNATKRRADSASRQRLKGSRRQSSPVASSWRNVITGRDRPGYSSRVRIWAKSRWLVCRQAGLPGLPASSRAAPKPEYDGEVKLTIELDREEDGRWIADALELPGVMCYGQTRDEAISNTERLAIEVIADRISHQELPSSALNVSFTISDEKLARV